MMDLISMKAFNSTLCEGPDTTMRFTEKRTSFQEIEENLVHWIMQSLKISCSTNSKNTSQEETTKNLIKPRYSDALIAKGNAKEMTLRISKT